MKLIKKIKGLNDFYLCRGLEVLVYKDKMQFDGNEFEQKVRQYYYVEKDNSACAVVCYAATSCSCEYKEKTKLAILLSGNYYLDIKKTKVDFYILKRHFKFSIFHHFHHFFHLFKLS